MAKKNDVFIFSKTNVSNYVQKKMGLSYLNWAFVVDTLKSNDPGSTYSVKRYPEIDLKSHQLTGRKVNYFAGINGNDSYVTVTVTFRGKSHTESLPCYNFKGRAVQIPDAMLVNKTIKRCFVKAAAMLTGLGIGLYIGSTLGDGSNENNRVNHEHRSTRNFHTRLNNGNASVNNSSQAKEMAMVKKPISNKQIKYLHILTHQVDSTKLNTEQAQSYNWAIKNDFTNANAYMGYFAINQLTKAPKKSKATAK